MTIDDYLRFMEMAQAANPHILVKPDIRFNFSTSVLLSRPLYNIETGEVNADTPRMHALLESALNIPLGSGVTFAPGGTREAFSAARLGTDHMLELSDALFERGCVFDGFTLGRMLWLQEYPNMQFSKPVLMASCDGDVMFDTQDSFAIMRQSPNRELAWELLRFMLTLEESNFSPFQGGTANLSFPVNRARFDSQLRDGIGWVYDQWPWRWPGLFQYLDLDDDGLKAHRAHSVDDATGFFLEAMEMFNAHSVINWSVIKSLVWPDIWLLYSGQQDIAAALTNIQHRLEFYVAE
jgi:hypothetical protein